MKKNFALLFSSLLLVFLLFARCSNDVEIVIEPVNLELDQNKVYLASDKSTTLTILSGNGDYTVSSTDRSVVTATVSDNKLIIKAGKGKDAAQAVIVIKDKYHQRASVEVNVANVLDLTVDKQSAEIIKGSSEYGETTFRITKGNSDYTLELLNNSANIVSIDQSQLNTSGRFIVKAKAKGEAQIKITDSEKKETIVSITVIEITPIEVEKNTIAINATQGSTQFKITKGEGNYKFSFSNPMIAKAYLYGGSVVSVTGKMNGSTTMTITDHFGQTKDVKVTVTGDNSKALNMGTKYFGYTYFGQAGEKSAFKQVTFELTCKMNGYRGLQTFMGMEGKLILRGENDDYKPTHPIRISGLGDKVMLLTKNSFDLNKWMNIALVVDCDKKTTLEKYKLYIDGIQQELEISKDEETHSVVNLAETSDGNRFTVGRATTQTWRAMQGVISEARVWTVARTSEQLKTNMCGLTETSPVGLLARWTFSPGVETNYIQDISGGDNEYNLTLGNADADNYDTTYAPLNAYETKGCPN